MKERGREFGGGVCSLLTILCNLMQRMTSHFVGSLNDAYCCQALCPSIHLCRCLCPCPCPSSSVDCRFSHAIRSTGCISITKLGLNNALALLLTLPAKKADKKAIAIAKTKAKVLLYGLRCAAPASILIVVADCDCSIDCNATRRQIYLCTFHFT